MYVYCVYPAMSKSTKQLPYCLKKPETSVVLIVFYGVLCEVSILLAYRNQIPAMSWSVTILVYSKIPDQEWAPLMR